MDAASSFGGLIDRGPEFGSLAAAVEGAAAGQGAVLLLTGKPGTGKSFFAAAARSLAEGAGMRTLGAGGQRLEQAHAFALALQLFDPLLATVGARERAKLLAGPAALAAPLFGDGPAARLVDEDMASLLHGLFHLTARTAARQPLALIVDDGQFADEPSLRFLLHLAARIAEFPILLVVVAGHGGGARRRRHLSRLAAMPATTAIQLGALGPPAIRQWLGPDARPSLVKAVHVATGGNPFLIGQVAASLPPDGARRRSGGELLLEGAALERVRDWSLEVIRQSGRGAQQLAEALALLGEESEPRHAAELAGIEETQTTVLADQLIETGVLSGERYLSFVQPIVRKALLAGRPSGERGDAHREAARILRRDGAALERVAAQLLEAGYAGEEWVVDALLEAAEAAIRQGAPKTAVTYLRRALEEPPAAERRPRLLLDLGRAEALAGDAQAVPHLTEALERISSPHDRVLAALDAGRVLYMRGLPQDAVKTLLGGLESVEDSDEKLRLRLALDTVARLTGATEAMAAAGRRDEPSETSHARRLLLAQRAFQGALWGTSRTEVADLARRALFGDRLIALETSDGLAVYLAAMALMFAEELSDAERALTLALDDASHRGSVLSAATAAYMRSLVRLRRGQLAPARADAELAISAERFGWLLGLPGALGVISDLELESGHPDAAEKPLAAGEQKLAAVDHSARAAFLARRGNWRLATGDPSGALADFLDCGGAWAAVGARSPSVYPWRSQAALALAEIGDRAGARALAEEELELAEGIGAPGAQGKALHALGQIEERAGRVEALEEAVACLERTEFTLELAHTLVDLGAALRRGRKRKDARDPLRRAVDLAGRCGAAQLVRRAQRELGATGAKPRRQAVSGLDALTPREQQVANLVGRGMSNREIAETLFVTVKTVEWHLHHIFEKLSVDAREELRGALGESPKSLR